MDSREGIGFHLRRRILLPAKHLEPFLLLVPSVRPVHASRKPWSLRNRGGRESASLCLRIVHANAYITHVTVTEASEQLRLAPATVRRQIANGRIGAKKVGRDWDIPEEEVRRYAALSRGRPGRRPKEPTLGLFDS
jgi:excisionase family DNA binding protein